MRATEQFRGMHVLVLGLAKSGEAAAKLLHKLGAIVTINDSKPYADNSQAQQLEALGMKVICGHHPVELLSDLFQLVVKNPGIPYSNVMVQKAEELGIPVITEIELTSRMSEADIIAITGSNGKTTTTTLIYEMLQGSSKIPTIAGNIGTVSCEVVQQVTADHCIVLETSSFQLLGTIQFKPNISVVLNIFDAHLDYHGTKQEYIRAKSKIFENQNDQDWLIYNYDDQNLVEAVHYSNAKKIPFSTKEELKEGAYIKDGQVYFKQEPIMELNNIVLPGIHNLENILAAVAASLTMGATQYQIQDVLRTFSGVAHRLQFVGEVDGRRFYNDSKATNNLATKKALGAFQNPVVLLAGGLDRGNSFDELIPAFERVHTVIVFGETKDKIRDVAKRAGIKTIVEAQWMEDAVSVAFKHSTKGDVILLSPACASWDQYRTFEERGNRFIQAVKALSVD
ncbi:UDP-N-acetylmuramoyl-L-alanine--D-glutamate ligase [Alkalihalobacillus hemicellulosilyticus]|uniref:UDP-N-acetylmuramoylalanine--D-glutamate ligase n=1 Tax=Halalkalibacter hemicellulosilyticusJCM 9152 TaxID=1236971 RepID=W4QCP0_9BACI|nr:UDP-N-acetylmuramoyl-L-alanine--D-glutamate ligase [Halalkalibacter hemicellulosilyticus]GAE29149.1 UDP-N-acetylmuramoylalanine-D-glutamate ligase [Halalkalibacter hemicellulosilyticusJCM 9152]